MRSERPEHRRQYLPRDAGARGERKHRLRSGIDLWSRAEVEKGISNTLVDGDITTYWGTVHRGGSGAQPEQQFGQFELDLGALFWVDTVRMLGDGSGIAPGRGAGYHRGGTFNYLWYQFYTSDGSRSVDGSLRWELMGELPSDPRNLQGIVHFEEHFPLRKVRHVRLFFPMSNGNQSFNGRIGTTAEWQVFGYGHPAEAVAVSPLFDLQSVQHITALHWDVDTPRGARLEIRSRTGNALQETFVFYDKNGKEVTQKRYDKLIPSFRGSHRHAAHPGSRLEHVESTLRYFGAALSLTGSPSVRPTGTALCLRGTAG